MISLLLNVFNKRDVIKNAVNSDQRLSPTVSKLLKSYVIPSYVSSHMKLVKLRAAKSFILKIL